MAKQDIDYSNIAYPSLLLSLLGSGAYIGKHHHLNEYNPFGKKNVTVVGGIKEWDPRARAEATKLILDSNNGVPVDPKKLENAKKLFMLDSFTAQSQGAADALHGAGVNVKFHRRALNEPWDTKILPGERVFNPDKFYKATPLSFNDVKGTDAILQIGDSTDDYVFKRARRKGSKIYRLLSDYGDGNFKQPDFWLEGQNWMKVRDPKQYDRLFVPGGDAKHLWDKLGKGRRSNVNVGLMPVSPIFEGMNFSKSPGAQAKAMLTIGGGTGGSLLLQNNGANFNNRYNFVGKDRTLFDDILEALRKKHGDNFKLDAYLGSAIGKPENILRNGKIEKGYIPSDVKLSKGLERLRDLLDPNSKRYQRFARTEKGRNFLAGLAKRYKGLNLISAVPQSDIGKAYSTSDYILTAPGSTTSEFASIKGQRHGGLIHLIPSQESWAPRHFLGNAKYTNIIMQPGAQHNIVNITSKDRASKILKAIEEGGFKDWGRKAPRSVTESLLPMVKAIKRDIGLARLGRIGRLGLLAMPGVAAGTYLLNNYRNNKVEKEDKFKSIWSNIKRRLS